MEKLKALFKKYEEIIMYIIMGVLTTLVYFIARFTARLVVSANVSVVIAQLVAITFAFITNKKYVFKSQTTTVAGFLKEMISFFMARGLSFLLDLAITEICINRLCGFFVRTFGFDQIDYTAGIFSIGFVSGLAGSPEKLNEFIWAFLSQVIILITNYVLSKLVVFRKKKEVKEA